MFSQKRLKTLWESDPKAYVEERFRFLTERGFCMEYYFKNGEEEYVFAKNGCRIDVWHEYRHVDVILRCGESFPYDFESNIRKLVSEPVDEQIRGMKAVEKIDYFAELVKRNLERIDNYRTMEDQNNG